MLKGAGFSGVDCMTETWYALSVAAGGETTVETTAGGETTVETTAGAGDGTAASHSVQMSRSAAYLSVLLPHVVHTT